MVSNCSLSAVSTAPTKVGPLSPLESEWAPLFFPSFFQQAKERGALQSESVGLDVARLESFRRVSNESWKESLSIKRRDEPSGPNGQARHKGNRSRHNLLQVFQCGGSVSDWNLATDFIVGVQHGAKAIFVGLPHVAGLDIAVSRLHQVFQNGSAPHAIGNPLVSFRMLEPIENRFAVFAIADESVVIREPAARGESQA